MDNPQHSLDDALKPCPFCETAPHLEANGAVKGGQIVVTDCRRGCPLSRAYIEVAAWNTRVEAAGVAELRDALDRAVNALHYIYETSDDEHASRKAKQAHDEALPFSRPTTE